MNSTTLFDGARLTMEDSIRLTIESLRTYGRTHEHWGIAYSGGKDSSATVTIVAHLLAEGAIPKPKSLTVLYADTRMELPPLQIAAMGVMRELQRRGIDVRVVLDQPRRNRTTTLVCIPR